MQLSFTHWPITLWLEGIQAFIYRSLINMEIHNFFFNITYQNGEFQKYISANLIEFT